MTELLLEEYNREKHSAVRGGCGRDRDWAGVVGREIAESQLKAHQVHRSRKLTAV